jgi:ParB family chromosome partitioning protein
MKMEMIDVSKIVPNPSQARTEFDKETLKGLAATIKTHGILQPISVRKMKKGYELISGERRLRASKLAKAKTIPAIVNDVNAEQQAEQSLIENIQREDLSPYEKGKALKAMKEQYKLTNEDLADRVGLARNTMEKYLVVGDMDKSVVLASTTDDAMVLASIARIEDKSLQLKVAEKTKDWTNTPLKLPFFGVKEARKVGGEGNKRERIGKTIGVEC